LLAFCTPTTALLALGCGSADASHFVQEQEPSQEVAIDTGINTCPSFQFSMILPQALHKGETASVLALATDPELGAAAVHYKWTATSGVFDKPEDSFSQYACADAGPQVLSVTASDPDGCEKSLDFDVACDSK
jgi:hypothetical protein